MKTKTLLLLLIALPLSLLATDNGYVGWITIIQPRNCPGGGHGPGALSPSTAFASEYRTETWRIVTTNGDIMPIGETIRKPKPAPANEWTVVDSGEIVSMADVITTNHWVQIPTLVYDNACCVHTGFVCLIIKDSSDFRGGIIATDELRVTTTELQIPAYHHGYQDICFSLKHQIDGQSLRNYEISIMCQGVPMNCPTYPDGFRPWMTTTNRSGVPFPRTIEIRQRSPGSTGRIFTNSYIGSTNWNFATSFPVDTNGNASVYVEDWAINTNQFYFMVETTNDP